MNYTKRQHIVPKFYLKGFSEGLKLQVLDFETSRTYSSNVNDASVHKDYYTINTEDTEPDVFEKWLSSIEARTATIIRSIESGTWPLNEEERTTLALFMVLQYQRGRANRDLIERIQSTAIGLLTHVQGFEAFSAKLDKLTPLSLTEEEKEQEFERIALYEQGAETTFKANAHQHVTSISNLVDKLIPYLVGRPWRLVQFERRSLITSDEPLGLGRPPGLSEDLGVGLLTAEFITFPLKRKLGLYMLSPRREIEQGMTVETVRSGARDNLVIGTTLHERIFNYLTVESAFRNLFYHPEDYKFVPPEVSSNSRST